MCSLFVAIAKQRVSVCVWGLVRMVAYGEEERETWQNDARWQEMRNANSTRLDYERTYFLFFFHLKCTNYVWRESTHCAQRCQFIRNDFRCCCCLTRWFLSTYSVGLFFLSPFRVIITGVSDCTCIAHHFIVEVNRVRRPIRTKENDRKLIFRFVWIVTECQYEAEKRRQRARDRKRVVRASCSRYYIAKCDCVCAKCTRHRCAFFLPAGNFYVAHTHLIFPECISRLLCTDIC